MLNNKDIDVSLLSDGHFRLVIACSNGRLNIVKVLLENESIQINAKSEYSLTPLGVECGNGKVELVKILLNNKDINVNLLSNRRPPLVTACLNGYLDIGLVNILLENKNIQINEKSEYIIIDTIVACCMCKRKYRVNKNIAQ